MRERKIKKQREKWGETFADLHFQVWKSSVNHGSCVVFAQDDMTKKVTESRVLNHVQCFGPRWKPE